MNLKNFEYDNMTVNDQKQAWHCNFYCCSIENCSATNSFDMLLGTWIGLFVIFILILYKWNHKVKYYIKFIVFIISNTISATIFVPCMLHRPKDSRNGLLPSWGCRMSAKLFLGVTYEVRGLENLVPEGQGCVVLINHQSSLDLVVMAHLWPHIPNGKMVTKREVFWAFPFGPACWLWGTVFIDKLDPVRAQKDVNATGQLINTEKARICMFPEGTRHSESTLLPFKKGAFHLALSAQCPVQPIVVSKYTFLDHKERRFDSGHNIIEILPSISTKGLGKNDIEQLMEKTRKIMQDRFTRLSAPNK